MHVWWFHHTFVHTHWYCTYHLCKYIKIKLYCILGDNITAEFDCKGTGKHVFNLTSIADHSKLLNLPEYAGGEDLKVNEVHLNGQYICICIFWSISMCISSGWIAKTLRFHLICILLYFLTPIIAPKVRKCSIFIYVTLSWKQELLHSVGWPQKHQKDSRSIMKPVVKNSKFFVRSVSKVWFEYQRLLKFEKSFHKWIDKKYLISLI